MQKFLKESASSDQASMGNAGIVQPIQIDRKEWNLYSKSRMQGTGRYKIRKD